MPIITDPDNLTYEIATSPSGTVMLTIDTTGLDITLTEVGALSSDGVTLQCLYSKLKEVWLSDDLAFDFPMESITDEQFEFVNDWRPANDATRELFRSAGWAERDAGTIVREYANMTSLGSFGASEQAYFDNGNGATDFAYAGPVNEGVQIYGGPSDGNFDRRGAFKAYLRIQGKTYDSYDLLTEQSLSSLTYRKYAFPLSNATDLNISTSDSDIDTLAPFTGMSVTYYSTAQTTDGVDLPDVLSGGQYDFGVVIQANGGTRTQVYEWFQRQLRKTTDIDDDASSLVGQVADDALEFVGSDLYTRTTENPDGGGGGVFIEGLDANSVNNTFFTDNTGGVRNYPFVAAGTISFNDNLVDDPSAEYWMYFSDDYGTASALLVNDNSGSPIAGSVPGASIAFDFDYDGNNQGGRTPGTDADVTIVAIGTTTAKFVRANATITRSVGQQITLVSALERNYANP